MLITGPLLTPDEVASALRLSTRTIADWRHGRGPTNAPKWLNVGDNKPVYPLSEVNRFLSEQLASAAARRESAS